MMWISCSWAISSSRRWSTSVAAEEVLRREVNPHVYGEYEFAEKVRRKEPFLIRVLDGPKLMLWGDTGDIGKPGRNRKAKAA